MLALLAFFGAVLILLPFTFGIPGGGSPPDSVTESGDAINEVYFVVFALATLVFLVVEGTLIFFIFRFRRRPGTPANAEGPQIHGNTRIEIAWTLIPALMLTGLAAYTFLRIPDVEAKPSAEEARDGLVVNVEAHQFYWQYEYPNGALSFDTLYLPRDRKVTLQLNSQDVAHSWWVPQLTGKRDAIPGQTNELHFRPREEGTFRNGVCGEFCGIQHARMTTRVEVLSPEAFEAWLDENEEADEVALGEAEWRAACAKCHGLEGEGDIGPAIAGNGSLTNRDALRELLADGQDLDANPGYMPPVGKGWQDRQVDALIAYVESSEELSGGAEGGR